MRSHGDEPESFAWAVVPEVLSWDAIEAGVLNLDICDFDLHASVSANLTIVTSNHIPMTAHTLTS
jgi:hypothetical protein